METNLEKAIHILKENKQEHILKLLNELEEEKKTELVEQVLSINFEQLNELYKEASKKPEILEKKLEHLKYVDKSKLNGEEEKNYIEAGENVIRNGEYAVVTMAGGQRTRLGHNGPKGTYKLDVKPEPKYLFQIFVENLLKANKKYGVILPWYIMTSTENNHDTVEFFKQHDYFGYDEKHIKFFKQSDFPLLSEEGKLMINKNHLIKFASDGNGAIYKAMQNEGVIEDMERRGVKWIFICSVDNALLNMADPILLGLALNDGNEIASKSVAKNAPEERVGVFCKINGAPGVIEYSEIPEELTFARDENGELLYGESNIICHLYTLDAIKKISTKNLKYHIAHKKCNYIDDNDEYIEVTEPNAYKFESFIFDAFKYFDDISLLRVKREEEFAPVKNKEGNDSPATATELYNAYHKYV